MPSSILYSFFSFIIHNLLFYFFFTFRGVNVLNSSNLCLNGAKQLLYLATKESSLYFPTFFNSLKLYLLLQNRLDLSIVNTLSFLIFTCSSFLSRLKTLLKFWYCFSATILCFFDSLPNGEY